MAVSHDSYSTDRFQLELLLRSEQDLYTLAWNHESLLRRILQLILCMAVSQKQLIGADMHPRKTKVNDSFAPKA